MVETGETLPIPPMDPLFLSTSDDLAFDLDDNYDFDFDFELTFDDLDNICLPPESEPFLPPSSSLPVSAADGASSPESGSSGVSGPVLDVDTFLNCSNSNSNSGSGLLSAGSPDSGNLVVDQKIKVEYLTKRKKEEDEEETISESRSTKQRKSSSGNGGDNEEEMRRKARLMRNRESAQLSRQRKKHYVEELEEKVRSMHSTIADLNTKISYFMAENATLRQQVTGGGNPPPPPHMGMYPPPHMAPMPYPWMPCAAAPYMVKPQGSQVPLVPIPRLKPQQTVSKAKKSDTSKTKKVASVSFLGLFVFMLLFGGLVPFVNVKYGGMGDAVSGGYFSSQFYDQCRGRVLAVNGHLNGSHDVGFSISKGKIGIGDQLHCERGVGNQESGSQSAAPSADEVVRLGNASEPLVASLYVPRNDKLVKIDGNLIIHSILASEKATASHEATRVKNDNNRETGLVPKDFTPALAIPDGRANGGRHSHLYRKPTERQKALSSGSADALKDHMKSSAADGKLQQWFREGHAGPLLSSGTCTEVFQFDVSAASAAGAIIPASSVANISVEHHKNATHVNKGRNRRILRGLPVPVNDLNVTREHIRRNSEKNSFAGNKSASPMIVSVLVDPREAGDVDVDSMITPKSLSRIFVVVLLDSVKYVTYSCVLPRSGPHLVTT